MRVARGWTQHQLATEATVNLRVVRMIERGTKDPEVFSTLLKLARALEVCSIDELFGDRPASGIL